MRREADTPPLGHYIIVADVRARPSGPFEAAIAEFGHCFRLNQLVWLLHSTATIAHVRNSLVQHLGNTDNLLVVNAANVRTASFNLGPVTEARIRTVWWAPQRQNGQMESATP